jgi:hypothetical protein
MINAKFQIGFPGPFLFFLKKKYSQTILQENIPMPCLYFKRDSLMRLGRPADAFSGQI